MAGRRSTRVRRADCVGVHRRDRRHYELFRGAVCAADRCCEQRAVSPWRHNDRDPERAALCGHRADAVFRICRHARRARAHPWSGAATAAHRGLHDRPERLLVFLDCAVERIARRSAAADRCATGSGLESNCRSAGLQPARHRQSVERSRHNGSRRAHPHL